MQPLCIALIAYGEFNKLTTSGTTSHRQVVSWESLENFDDISVVYKTGLLIFHGKKSKISRDFQGQIRGKITNFAGFLREKSQNLRKNRPISCDFRWRKVKIRRKIGPLRGSLAEKSQILKDFLGQILRKISQFHWKFWGETSPRNNQ